MADRTNGIAHTPHDSSNTPSLRYTSHEGQASSRLHALYNASRSPVVDRQEQAIKRFLMRGFSPTKIVRALRGQYRVSRDMVEKVARDPTVQEELTALQMAKSQAPAAQRESATQLL